MALIAHYPLNDDAATTAVNDTVDAHEGTAARNTADFNDTGKVLGCLNFNGTTDKVDVGADWIAQADFSFAAWIKIDASGGGGYGRIFDNGKTCAGMSNNTTTLFGSNDGGSTLAASSAILSTGTWFHVVGVRVNIDWLWYINGVLANASIGTGGTRAAASTNLIVGNRNAADRGWDGCIDDLRFYDAILTPAQVLAIYNNGNGTELDAPAITFPAVGTTADGTFYGWTGVDIEGTRIDCPVADARKTGTPYYGNPASLVDGTAYIPTAANTRYGVNVDATTGLLEIPNDSSPTGTQDATSDALVKDGMKYGSPERTGSYVGGGGYTYGDEDPAEVLTTADGEGTYHAPDAAEVISTAVFGPASVTAGTYDVSNVAAGNIKDGVSIGGVEGNYDPMAAAVFPAEANVSTVESAYGPTGAEYAGALDLGDYTLSTGIVWPAEANVSDVEAAWGPTGAEYAGSLDLSLYTLTATVVSTIDAAKADILDTRTLYTVTGTFDESARNTDPGVGNVRDGTTYLILGASKTGTLDVTGSGGGVIIQKVLPIIMRKR